MAGRHIFGSLQKIRNLSSSQRCFTAGRMVYNKPTATSSSTVNADVPGLTSNCIQPTSEPVGPGASKDSKDYKNPEYFCYSNTSYFEAEVEMLQYRCPQPSNKKPHQPQ